MPHTQNLKEMRKYFVDAELTGMIGSAYEATESLEIDILFVYLLPNNYNMSVNKGHDMIGDSGMTKSTDSTAPPANSFEQSIHQYDLLFTSSLLTLLNMINDMAKDNNTKKLVNIMYRLNFNSFYAEKLDYLIMENSTRQSQDRDSRK